MDALAERQQPPTELGSGRYSVGPVLGHGGVGTVYQARDAALGRDVALKVLDPSLVGTKVQKRFLREGGALRTLAHPNIVRVHDVGHDGPFVWMAMELMDRGTAHALVKERNAGLPESWVLHIADCLLAGLQQVHALGWVHRDVKPGNVLLDRAGQVKLGDFGIVRDDGSDLTSPGVSLGTSAYMSPEQQEDATRVTARSDLYALGATLFALSTGRAPRHLAWLEEGDIRWTETWSLVPERVRGILRKACAFSPANRYTDATAMRDAVRARLVDLQRGPREAQPSS